MRDVQPDPALVAEAGEISAGVCTRYRRQFWHADVQSVAFAAALENLPAGRGLAVVAAKYAAADTLRRLTHMPRRLRNAVAAGTAHPAQLEAANAARNPGCMDLADKVSADGKTPDCAAEVSLDTAWVLENLPPRMSGVLRAYYFRHETLDEIASQEGVSLQRAQQLVKKSLELARKMLEEDRGV